VVLGAGRDALAAMICIRFSIISKWAEKNRISFTTYTDLASRPEVYALLRKEVEAVNATLPPAQRISRFPLAVQGTRRRRRRTDPHAKSPPQRHQRKICRHHRRDLWRPKRHPIDTVIRFQDGTTQRIRTTLARGRSCAPCHSRRPRNEGRIIVRKRSHHLVPCGEGLTRASTRLGEGGPELRKISSFPSTASMDCRVKPGNEGKATHVSMNLQFLIQLLVNGLVVGTLYGVVAMSFVLIYKATQVVNFAQGELLLVGAWVCWALLTKYQVPFWVGMPLTLVFMFVFGIAIQIVILRPMIGEPIISVIMVTIGLSTVFQAALKWIFGVNPQPFPRCSPASP
jgi:hypothetical protein